jgi:hypothetical protein
MPADFRKAAARAGVVLALAAIGACSSPRPIRQFEPNARVTICGHELARGAAVPEIRTLSSPGASTPAAPAASVLPAAYHGPVPGLGSLRIVRVAPGCTEGTTVLVAPTGPIRTQIVVRAPDGTIIALVLVHLNDTPVTVYAYRGGKAIGELTV